jgi:transposase
MYLLIMAIRSDALPTDAAALTEMVLALDAENEKLRVAMQTLKEMVFGKRSERLAILGQRFLSSNHIRRLRRVCMTKYG